MPMRRHAPLERFLRLLVYMSIFGALLLVAAVVGGVLGVVPGGAAVAIATPGAIALGVGLWEHRRFSRRLSRLREERP